MSTVTPAQPAPAPGVPGLWSRWRRRLLLPPAPAKPVVAPWYARWGAHVLALLLTAAVWWGCYRFYSQENGFPLHFHPDERTKVAQVLGQMPRNFFHPLLLLEASTVVAEWAHGPDYAKKLDAQATVELGRRVSAGLAAMAVAALALAAYLTAGLPALLVAGAAAAFCPSILLNAHFMKEDTALLAGIALVVLTARLLWSWRDSVLGQVAAAGLLGIAVGVAASGKYVGLAAAALALPALLLAPTAGRWSLALARPLVFLPYLVLALGAINYRVLQQWRVFMGGLNKEATHAVTDHFGLTMDRPNAYFLSMTWQECNGVIWAFLGVYAVMLVWGGRKRTLLDWLLPLFAAGFLVMVSYSVIPWARYVLPVVVLAHFLAGIAGVWLIQQLRLRWYWRGPLFAGLLALFLAVQVPRCLDYVGQFRDDSRTRLRAWVLANLPKGSTVVEDAYAGLASAPDRRRWPTPGSGALGGIRVLSRQPIGSAAEFGTLEMLRQQGIAYVAVAEGTYDRYFNPYIHPVPEYQAEYDRRQQWYQRLSQEGTLRWRAEPTISMGPNSFANPKVSLYQILPERKAEAPAAPQARLGTRPTTRPATQPK